MIVLAVDSGGTEDIHRHVEPARTGVLQPVGQVGKGILAGVQGDVRDAGPAHHPPVQGLARRDDQLSARRELHALHARLHAEVVEHVHVAVIDGAGLFPGPDDTRLHPRLRVRREGVVEERHPHPLALEGERGVMRLLRRGGHGKRVLRQLADALGHDHQLILVRRGPGIEPLDGVELLRNLRQVVALVGVDLDRLFPIQLDRDRAGGAFHRPVVAEDLTDAPGRSMVLDRDLPPGGLEHQASRDDGRNRKIPRVHRNGRVDLVHQVGDGALAGKGEVVGLTVQLERYPLAQRVVPPAQGAGRAHHPVILRFLAGADVAEELFGGRAVHADGVPVRRGQD